VDEREKDAGGPPAKPPARQQATAASRPLRGDSEGPGDAERQRTIDSLCEAFANDEIEVEEFERRVATAHRASTAQDLRRLLDDLPSGRLPAKPVDASAPVPASDYTGHVPRRHPGDVREWAFTVGIMGGMSRQGYWVPAAHNVAIGVMGGCSLDFREAAFPPGETELHVLAFWGGIEIIVPPWLRVEVSGIGLMGGFDHAQNAAPPADPNAPVLRISGVAIMGGVGIETRLPGESAKDARRRVKEGKKLKDGMKLKSGKDSRRIEFGETTDDERRASAGRKKRKRTSEDRYEDTDPDDL
jgi:hypothetical protein